MPSLRVLSAGESAWLVALPCALILLAAILLLGPPLGHTLFAPPAHAPIWHRYYDLGVVRPEPVEHARYVISLLGPLLLAACALALAGRSMPAIVLRALRVLAQSTLLAFVVVCVVYQYQHVYESAYASGSGGLTTVYFSQRTLLVAAAIALLAVVMLRHRPTVARVERLTRETPLRRAFAIGAAALVTAAYLISAFNTEGTINLAHFDVWVHMPFWTDEAFAILNGQAPLVDFHAQYGSLWAYVAAGGMTLLGASLGVYAAIMLAGTAATMAVVLATLRRIVGGSSLQALALFLPFVATSFYMKLGPPANRYSVASLFSMFPMRYAGPYVLLWLLVRRSGGAPAGRSLPLFAVAGVVVINNPEFGVPAFGATLAALAWTERARSLRALGALAAQAAAGVLAAAVLVCALTLAVAGSLPHFAMLLTFPRIFGTQSFALLPMPPLGMHLVVYATFASAIVVAVVRAETPANRPLTAALAWCGIFGLGAGAYFTGRSHPHVLIDLFSAWSLTLLLLGVVAVRAIQRRPSRRPQLAELLVLAGFGVMACSLAQVPTPWSQIDRLSHAQRKDVRVTTAYEDVIATLTHRGEPVAMLIALGHHIAYDVGARDVTPYANIGSMITYEQWTETIAALRRAHGTKLFVTSGSLFTEQIHWLARRGYYPTREAKALALIEFAARSG
jgi:hypothetical protein